MAVVLLENRETPAKKKDYDCNKTRNRKENESIVKVQITALEIMI